MLLRRVEIFLKASRMPPATFGRRALGDSRFVFDLRDGREPRQTVANRVEAFIAAHQDRVS